MTYVHVYVGLPGSGKTFLAKRDSLRLGGLLLDDPEDISLIRDAIVKNNIVLITDPNLCFQETRMRFEDFIKTISNDIYIEYHFFENDIDKCWNNVCQRNDGRKISKAGIKLFSLGYKIPDGAEQIEIWENKC